MIPQRDLSLLGNRLQRESGGRRIPEAVLERDYCLAWFLVGLSQEPLGQRLAFKGGTALKRCHFGDYRFSEDLDFTLTQSTTLDELKAGLEPIFARVKAASGITFRFQREDRNSHLNSHTFYLAYEGPLPSTPSSPKEVKVDVTIKEKLVFEIVEIPVVRGYAEYSDLPENSNVRVYALNEIASEKVVALLDRARNEPRDLYDIWFLTENGHVGLGELIGAIEDKLKFRTKKLDDVRGELDKKEARLKALWATRLSAQMATLPEFAEVFRAVRRSFRQAGLTQGN